VFSTHTGQFADAQACLGGQNNEVVKGVGTSRATSSEQHILITNLYSAPPRRTGLGHADLLDRVRYWDALLALALLENHTQEGQLQLHRVVGHFCRSQVPKFGDDHPVDPIHV
jgi:hypothetical protein